MLTCSRSTLASLLALSVAAFPSTAAFVPLYSPQDATVPSRRLSALSSDQHPDEHGRNGLDRRQALQQSLGLLVGGAATGWTLPGSPAAVWASTTGADGNMPDLPPDATRSYLQYRIPLQISADFYVFDLRELLSDPNQWGTIGELFSSASARGGQGNPSRIEREYTNVMRIVGLSMPPDIAEEMRDAQFGFERAMATISKNTAGIRRDLPVELDPLALPAALKAWDDGRVALNAFFTCLNAAVGLSEMQTIPPTGPQQFASYGRSQRRYLDYKKKVKLCQNRGGPQLSQAWGGLMISGYMQDSCGIPDLEDYFYQS